MSGKWRLVNGKQLYDIRRDPGQKDDIAGKHPDQVVRLRVVLTNETDDELKSFVAKWATDHAYDPREERKA